MSYSLFIDESGDHNLKSYRVSGEMFLLCGCVVEDNDQSDMDRKIDEFKIKHFGTRDIVLHYRDIRKRQGIFGMLLDKDKNDEFIQELKNILSSIDFRIIASVIDKKTHIEEYGRVADDPYELSLNFVVERYIFCSSNELIDGTVIVEKRGTKEDDKLLEKWVKIYQRGTGYIDSSEIQRKIKELKMRKKSDNIVGLQIADIAASSILRKFIHPERDEELFEVLKPKILVVEGEYMGRGIKVFPANSSYSKTISSIL